MKSNVIVAPDNSLRISLSDSAPLNLRVAVQRLSAVLVGRAESAQSSPEAGGGGGTPFSSFSNYTSFSRGTF